MVNKIQKKGEVMGERKRFSDVISGKLYPDLEQKDIKELLDKDLLVKDVTLLDGNFGEFAVILFEDFVTGKEYTTACGGMVVVKKLKEAQEKSLLPLIGTITKEGRYYDIR